MYRITEHLAKDKDIVIECLLLAHGFCKATELSSMLLGCLKDLQVSDNTGLSIHCCIKAICNSLIYNVHVVAKIKAWVITSLFSSKWPLTQIIIVGVVLVQSI